MDLLDVGVRVRHQLAGLRMVVKREVQPLQVRDQPHAQVRLDAQRELERGESTQARAHCLDRAGEQDEQGPLQCNGRVAFRDAVVDGDTGQ